MTKRTSTKNQLTKDIAVIGEITSEGMVPLLEELTPEKLKDIDMIRFKIMTPGGDLTAGWPVIDVVDYLKTHFSKKVISIGVGDVCSAGLLFLSLGDERYLYPHAGVFIHPMQLKFDQAVGYQKLPEIKIQNDKIWEDYMSYMAARFGVDYKMFSNLCLKNERFMTDDEIERYNIATRLEKDKKWPEQTL
jgi:ATP-dependent protease ClpP protease subunit